MKIVVTPNEIKELMCQGEIIVEGNKIVLFSRKLIPPTRIDKKWEEFW